MAPEYLVEFWDGWGGRETVKLTETAALYGAAITVESCWIRTLSRYSDFCIIALSHVDSK